VGVDPPWGSCGDPKALSSEKKKTGPMLFLAERRFR
jgi:hypothetical protein